MATITHTVNEPRLPKLTLSYDTDDREFTCVCEVIGLAPERTVSLAEKLDGITSLNPPTVRTRTRQECVKLLVRATLTSWHQSPDSDVQPIDAARVSYAVSSSFARALRLVELDVVDDIVNR